MVTPFRGVAVVEVGNGPVSLILLVGISPLVPQTNFFNPVGHLVDRGIPGQFKGIVLGSFFLMFHYLRLGTSFLRPRNLFLKPLGIFSKEIS